MVWEKQVENRIKRGGVYTLSGIGKVKVIGNVNQFGGRGNGGALFVECEIVESEREDYPIGSKHELNAEFMR